MVFVAYYSGNTLLILRKPGVASGLRTCCPCETVNAPIGGIRIVTEREVVPVLIVEHSMLLSALLELSLVTLSVTLGIRFGMRIRSNRAELSIDTSEASDIAQCPSLPDTEQAHELLVHLHDVATSLAGDVHEHTDAIQASSRELVTLSENEDDSATGSFLQVIEGIVAANQRLERQLEEQTEEIEKQARLSERLLQDALTDALTQIPNRRAFDQEIEQRFAEFKRYQTPVSVLLVDVDKFKPFNDLHGHHVGDFVLHGVASVFAESMREMDLPARYGGEEFAAILPRTNLRVAKQRAERCVRRSKRLASATKEITSR